MGSLLTCDMITSITALMKLLTAYALSDDLSPDFENAYITTQAISQQMTIFAEKYHHA